MIRKAFQSEESVCLLLRETEGRTVEWNSLIIDRYDGAIILSAPPPSRRRRNPQTSHSSSADAEIDYERYLDLPSQNEEHEEDANPEPVGGFNAVPFSYGNYEDSSEQKIAETESEVPRFHPPFRVPDSLLQNLPPTEKVHQIIARTALFVSKNGGQSEIVLRVKQGNNPTFGFLMPDHHLHPYFRFLVDHQDLLQSKEDKQTENEETSNTGALSLLGSVYGTGEDDDVGTEHASSSSKEFVDVDTTMMPVGKDEPVSKQLISSKEDVLIIKRNSLSNALKPVRTSSLRKDDFSGSVSAVPDKLRASSLPPIPKNEHILVDPSSDMKLLVDKIVEFIIKNGRQFETVLMEQDRAHGRLPFLIPSNIFHPYYLKVLQKAQEFHMELGTKLTVKSFHNEKEDSRGHISNNKLKVDEKPLVESDDIPFDSERKEKFKMVINKSKREGSDMPAKATEQSPGIQVDATQAAAILQAATRGIKPPNLGNLFGQPSNEADSSDTHLTHEQKLKAERLKRAKMFVAQLKSGAAPSKSESSRGVSAEPQGSVAENSLSTTPIDFHTKDEMVKTEKIVKTEEEYLNDEKRAKRKYRARKVEEGDTSEDEDDVVDEREGKRTHRHHTEKHRSRDHVKKHRSHRSSGKHDEEGDTSEDDDDVIDEREGKRTHRHHTEKHRSRDYVKKHRSHRSSRKHDEERDRDYSRKNKHQSSSSYEDDQHESEHEYARKKHQSHRSSHDEDEIDSDDKYSRTKRTHRSHKSSNYSRDKHKHRKSHSSRHRQKLDVSSSEELRDHSKAEKHKQGSNSEIEELEEGEISSKLSGQSRGGPIVNGASREPSVDVSSQDRRPVETAEVSDDLRAKVRAMLMSTM
ncbi:splicing factor, suppressor of white-apricot [Tanacetum coccineum]